MDATYLNRAFPELKWADIVAAARDRAQDVTELSRLRAEERLRTEPNPARLVGLSTAAALLGMTGYQLGHHLKFRPERLPTVVVTLGRSGAMLEADVRAHAAGKRYPRREVGELTGKLVSRGELGPMIGCTHLFIESACARRAWPRDIPEPDGHYANQNYWVTENVKLWMAEHPTRRRRTRQ